MVAQLPLVTLRCWWPIYTVLDDGTPPPVHTVMEPMKQLNIWSYTAQRLTRPRGICGPTPTTKGIQDACGVELPGEDRGGDPSP